jgi:hypothetical protein
MSIFHFACSTCRVSMIEGGGDAAGWSIFALLVVILSVLGGVGFTMIRMIRRDARSLDPEFRDDLLSR